jgi:triple functional domain protein
MQFLSRSHPQASSIDAKQNWVKKLREMIQETYFNTALPNLSLNSAAARRRSTFSDVSPQFISREFDDGASLDGSLENVERGSLASFGSGTTTDSENQKVSQ